jgi:hypothetical protein
VRAFAHSEVIRTVKENCCLLWPIHPEGLRKTTRTSVRLHGAAGDI